MVHSIVCHLWKKSKIEKKFLPLPPLPKSQPASIDIQELLIDSISEAKGEISPSSTSVLESSTTYDPYTFRFGNFHHSILDSKPSIPIIIPEIDGSAIKIGEIICFLKSEISQFKAKEEYMKLKNLEYEFVVSESVKKSNDFITNLDFVPIRTCCSPHRINNTALAVDFVFDPSGVVMYLSVTLLYGAMIFVSPSTFGLLIVFVVEFSGEFVVLVFDPGGNRH
ncbi:hypothetical protein QL285_082415 [Trifolium repens]|nr:hypothetical protein QL285_082415 [Trifolium repens]